MSTNEFEASLGKFNPPLDYHFEPPLGGAVPRAIPGSFEAGPHASRLRTSLRSLLVSALACFVLSLLPFVERMGDYLLPLAYLPWIGLGIVVCAAVVAVRLRWHFGDAFTRFREGTPQVGRVVGIRKQATVYVNGVPTHFAFVTAVEVASGQGTGDTEIHVIKSFEFPWSQKDEYVNSLIVGQYVTALRNGRDFQLYGYLDLDPEVSYVRRSRTNNPVVKLALSFTALALFLGNLYVYIFYSPLRTPAQLVSWTAVGGGLLSAFFLFVLWKRERRTASVLAERNRQALEAGRPLEAQASLLYTRSWPQRAFFALVLVALTCMTVACWLVALNGMYDRSPARYDEVRVLGAYERTHYFLVREYTLEYEDFTGSKTRVAVSVDTLRRLRSETAWFEIHQGAFGWPWIKDILPQRPR